MWPGEADEAHLALLLGLVERFEHAALGVGQFGVVVEADAVDLPQVEVVGLEPAQRLVEHLHGQVRAAAVRADLGHEEDLVAAPFRPRPSQSSARPFQYSQQLSKKVMPASTASWTKPDGLLDGLETRRGGGRPSPGPTPSRRCGRAAAAGFRPFRYHRCSRMP